MNTREVRSEEVKDGRRCGGVGAEGKTVPDQGKEIEQLGRRKESLGGGGGRLNVLEKDNRALTGAAFGERMGGGRGTQLIDYG